MQSRSAARSLQARSWHQPLPPRGGGPTGRAEPPVPGSRMACNPAQLKMLGIRSESSQYAGTHVNIIVDMFEAGQRLSPESTGARATSDYPGPLRRTVSRGRGRDRGPGSGLQSGQRRKLSRQPWCGATRVVSMRQRCRGAPGRAAPQESRRCPSAAKQPCRVMLHERFRLRSLPLVTKRRDKVAA